VEWSPVSNTGVSSDSRNISVSKILAFNVSRWQEVSVSVSAGARQEIHQSCVV